MSLQVLVVLIPCLNTLISMNKRITQGNTLFTHKENLQPRLQFIVEVKEQPSFKEHHL